MVYRLTDELIFPDPHYGDPDGLLAVGGDLSIDRLILAYSNGIFPWYAFREGIIQWWCPLDRFVIFPNEIRLSFLIRYLTVSYVFPKLLPDTGKQFFRPYKRSDIEIFFLIIIEDFTIGLLLHTA